MTNLINTYKDVNPDILLINSHGAKGTDKINIQGYNTYKINSSGEISDGNAILIKREISHKIIDGFMTCDSSANSKRR